MSRELSGPPVLATVVRISELRIGGGDRHRDSSSDRLVPHDRPPGSYPKTGVMSGLATTTRTVTRGRVPEFPNVSEPLPNEGSKTASLALGEIPSVGEKIPDRVTCPCSRENYPFTPHHSGFPENRVHTSFMLQQSPTLKTWPGLCVAQVPARYK